MMQSTAAAILATVGLLVSAVGAKVVNDEFDKVLDAAMQRYGRTIDPYNISGQF